MVKLVLCSSFFQRLSSGAGPADAKVERLRLRELHQEGGGGERHRADERTVAGVALDKDQLGHAETAKQQKRR